MALGTCSVWDESGMGRRTCWLGVRGATGGTDVGVALMRRTTTVLALGIKQRRQLQQRLRINHRLCGRPQGGAQDFVEHPPRNTAHRRVGQTDQHLITLMTGTAAQHLKFATKQGVMHVMNPMR